MIYYHHRIYKCSQDRPKILLVQSANTNEATKACKHRGQQHLGALGSWVASQTPPNDQFHPTLKRPIIRMYAHQPYKTLLIFPSSHIMNYPVYFYSRYPITQEKVMP